MKGTHILNSNWKSINLIYDSETELSAGASMEAIGVMLGRVCKT
jgi:hypothetical protein